MREQGVVCEGCVRKKISSIENMNAFEWKSGHSRRTELGGRFTKVFEHVNQGTNDEQRVG